MNSGIQRRPGAIRGAGEPRRCSGPTGPSCRSLGLGARGRERRLLSRLPATAPMERGRPCVSRETGQRYRLPSESEWEYAARADTTTPWFWGARVSDRCEHANGRDSGDHCDDGWGRTAPVGSFLANGFGLHDMAGSVWEWEDCWHDNYDGAPIDGSAWARGGDRGQRESARGSRLTSPPRRGGLRSANRLRVDAECRSDGLGLRVDAACRRRLWSYSVGPVRLQHNHDLGPPLPVVALLAALLSATGIARSRRRER